MACTHVVEQRTGGRVRAAVGIEPVRAHSAFFSTPKPHGGDHRLDLEAHGRPPHCVAYAFRVRSIACLKVVRRAKNGIQTHLESTYKREIASQRDIPFLFY